MLSYVRQSKPELHVIKIKVTDGAKRVIQTFADANDMTEQGVASRIYERFGQLPREVQLWFLGITTGKESQGMQKFAEMVLGATEENATNPTRAVNPTPRRKMSDLAVVD
jgi:hypothetical protein